MTIIKLNEKDIILPPANKFYINNRGISCSIKNPVPIGSSMTAIPFMFPVDTLNKEISKTCADKKCNAFSYDKDNLYIIKADPKNIVTTKDDKSGCIRQDSDIKYSENNGICRAKDGKGNVIMGNVMRSGVKTITECKDLCNKDINCTAYDIINIEKGKGICAIHQYPNIFVYRDTKTINSYCKKEGCKCFIK